MALYDKEMAEIYHRRGTIMGLTVAESFMLIAFILLMLLSLWRAQADEALSFLSLMSDKEKSAVETLALAGDLDGVTALVEAGIRPGEALAAVGVARSDMVLVSRSRLSTIEDTARLVEESHVRDLAEIAAKLPPDQRRALSELVALEDYRAALEKLEAHRQVTAELVQTREAHSKATAELNRNREQLSQLVAHLDEAQAEIAELEARLGKKPGEALEERIRRQFAAAAEEQAALVETLRATLGVPVQEIGGHIEADGTVVLPERVVFRPGEAQIQPAMARFLDAFCAPWIGTLRNSGRTIDEIRIEGHASPEWSGAGARAAFENNLHLSQRRAAAVLLHCLDLLGDPEEQAWAKAKLAAVGYSSSRPLRADGADNWTNSRRVVFSVLAPPAELLDAIEDEVEAAAPPTIQ